MRAPAPFRCELCGDSRFTDVFLPNADGLPTVRSGLLACSGCRIVYQPPPAAPVCNTAASGFRGFGQYGPKTPG